MTNNKKGMEELFEYQKNLRQNDTVHEDNDKLFALYNVSTGEEKIKVRNKIIENNLRLVVNFLIYNYNYTPEVNPVFDIDDVIQESSLILIEAIDKYDSSKGKFSTFLYRKLRNTIYYINGIPNSPINFSRGFVYRYKFVKSLIDLGYDDEFISKKSKLPIKTIDKLRLLLNNSISYEELIESNQMERFTKVQDEKYGDYLISRIIEQPNIEKRNQEILNSFHQLKLRDRLLLIRMFSFDGNETIPTITSLKENFGYKGKVIYNRWKTAKKIFQENELLKEAFNNVDDDYDDHEFDKTYYLQM